MPPDPVAAAAWWRDRLLAQMPARRQHVALRRLYYDKGGPMPAPPVGAQQSEPAWARTEYERLCRLSVANWVAVVADAPAQRLAVVGFRSGADESAAGDKDAWRIWQRNQLDADSGLVHETSLQTGTAAVLVWADSDGRAVITPEDPSEVIVAYEPGSRRRRAAALKLWGDEGESFAVVYRPEGIYKWKARTATITVATQGPADTQRTADVAVSPVGAWEAWRPPSDSSWPVPNPPGLAGVVPMVEFRAKPSLRPAPFGGGPAEFDRVLVDQDRVNKSIFDRLVTGEYMGFPQRYVKGWDFPTDAEGNPDPQARMRMSRSRLWTFGDDDAEPGQFPAADFTPFIKGVEFDIASMAATTFTPPYYHPFGDMVNISAESIKAIEAGFLSKNEAHALHWGEDWEEVIRLGLAVESRRGAADMQSQVLWRDLENRTWAQTVDAVLKMRDLGVPLEACWERLPGSTPQEVARWRALLAVERLREAPRPAPPLPAPSLGPEAPPAADPAA